MHPHVEAVFVRLDDSRAALRAAVDAVPQELRGRRPAPDRWSVNEVLEHLSLVEGLFARRIADAIAAACAAGLGEENAPRPPLAEKIEAILTDRGNARVAPPPAQPGGTLDDAAAWSAVERARTTMREAIVAGEGRALSEVNVDHPAFGSMCVYQWVELIAGHEARHTAQIREIGGQLAAA